MHLSVAPLERAWGVWLVLVALGAMSCSSASSTVPPVSARPVARPASAAPPLQDDQQTELTLPFRGTWIVGQGYHGSESHHGRAAYALDLVALDEAGRAHGGEGKRLQDWHGFGADVLAVADGVVVRAIDSHPDNRVMGTATNPNTVIVEHARAEFSEYVHLQRGSLRVRAGDRVQRGDVLARCGNSGAQTPHLHWALLSSVDPIRTRPAVFSDYEVLDAQGAWQPARGTPKSGDVIRQRSRPAARLLRVDRPIRARR
jgi:murein DD-endopeptidase MepM/ murein hydrolase activator NlpD